MSTNEAPPYWPVMYGKRQTLPRPMAQPAETKIKPRRVEKLPLFSKDFPSIYKKVKEQVLPIEQDTPSFIICIYITLLMSPLSSIPLLLQDK